MNKELQNIIIQSLEDHPEDWSFGRYTANNQKFNIKLWISNRPYADLSVHRPMETRRIGGFITRMKVRKLIERAKSLQLLEQFKK